MSAAPPASPDAPPLPGEVWRGMVHGTLAAVVLSDGYAYAREYLATASNAVVRWRVPIDNATSQILAAWALSLLARAEAAESALAAERERASQIGRLAMTFLERWGDADAHGLFEDGRADAWDRLADLGVEP